jgi:hypothetical protein
MIRRIVQVVLAGAGAVALCGCTLIGLAVGAHSDHGKPLQEKPVDREEVDMLKPGADIQVQLWDGRRLTGEYAGLEWARPDQYGPRYEAARTELAPEMVLPALGPGARLVVTNGNMATGDFRGVGPGFVRFVEPGRAEESIKTHRIVTLTDAGGRSVTGEALDALVKERRLPTVTGLRVWTVDGNEVIDHAQVAGVSRLVRSHSGRTTGLLVGLAIDVAVVGWFAYEMSQPWTTDSSTTNGTSCPLVDSFDGHGWVLDAEPLGGAIYRAAERTDVARLDRVAEVAGHYRIRIRNDQNEIDHLDAVALRVVDHSPGTEVVPDALGRLHVFRTAVTPEVGRVIPSSAPDRRTGSVAALVAASDGEAWVSDWWGRDPSIPGDLRDGIELTYPRPEEASSALLVARVGATALGPRLLADVLALQGRDLGRFYASLEARPAAREAFERAREREVLPTVRLFDGTEWRVAGHLRDLPSLVRREQALPLDLRGIPGSTLRVRIDGPPGLWAVDRAVVAFDSEEALVDGRVPVESATSDDGRDVSDLLGRPDHRRLSLRPHRDAVTLSFPVPRRRPGRERTVLVEATGYYSVIVGAEGEPQREAFRRLVQEPGAVARFALERLRDRARVAALPAAPATAGAR